MRTVYLGTSAFAAGVLKRLAGGSHRPVLVITRPDRPRGRGQRLASPPVAQTARELGIDLFQPTDVNDEAARDRIARTGPEAVGVCAFGALIREPLLSAHPMLNVHPSLLPRWRGAAPVERAIMAGDARTGVSIMRLVAELDAGPVCLQEAEPIEGDDTYGSLSDRLESLSARLLGRALDRSPPFVAQDESAVTYADKIEAADRLLDPGRSAVECERTVRALAPHIGARLALGSDEFLGVRVARAHDGGPPSGELRKHEGRLLLGCATGALELVEVQPPGGRPMDAAAYLRGRPLG